MAYKETAPKAGSGKTEKKRAREIEARVQAMIQDSLSYHQTELSRFRTKAGKYYRGEPFGDEEDGRSKVVLTEVRDAVLQQLPSLMRVFFGPDGAVEFVARRPDAVDLAEQQTDYINYIFTEVNPGFFILYSAFKDAMVRRLGVIKWWWEEKDVIEAQRLNGVTDEELQGMLAKEPDLEIERDSAETNEDGTLSVVVRRKVKRGEIRLDTIPPEEFIYNRSARSLDDAVLVAHVTTRTYGELKAMGYTDADLKPVGAGDALLAFNEERESRRPNAGTSFDTDMANQGENMKMSYVEAYVRMDFGEGLEHRKMCFVGAKLRKINEEPAPDRPFVAFTPDPEPHEIQGLSLSDMGMDLQLINSHIARGILNSLNLSLQPRTVFNADMVSVKDLMNVEIGGLVRTIGDPNTSVRELTHTFVGAEGLNVLEYFKGVKEERFGTTRASAGLNPDALQSSSQAAVDATVNKAEARTELMARVFAEGLKTLFKGLYNLARRNQMKPLLLRLRGKYTTVDPSAWPSDPDVRVRVGIGAGTKQEKMAFYATTAEKQEAIQQALGLVNPLTDIKKYRRALAEQARLMGFDPSVFWKEISDEQVHQIEEQAQSAPPQEDPAAKLAEAQVQNEGLSLQNDQLKAQADAEYKMKQLELEREKMEMQMDLERDKMEMELFLRTKELELKYKATIDAAQIKADMERDRSETQAGTAMLQGMMDNAQAAEQTSTEPGSESDLGGEMA